MPTHGHLPYDPQSLTRLCNRKIRIGAGTCQCSNGHREPYARSGKPAVEPAAERVRTCDGEHHEQVPELHCKHHPLRFRISSVSTWVTHHRLPLSNTNPISFATTKLSSLKNPNLPNRTFQTPPPQKCHCYIYRITSAPSYALWPERQSQTLQDKRALVRRKLTLMTILPKMPKTPNPMKPC